MHDEQLKELIASFVESICQLSKANRLTGIWDNRRFQECKKELGEADLAYVYFSEKMSRKNVEKRAKCRNEIEKIFIELVSSLKNEYKGRPHDNK